MWEATDRLDPKPQRCPNKPHHWTPPALTGPGDIIAGENYHKKTTTQLRSVRSFVIVPCCRLLVSAACPPLSLFQPLTVRKTVVDAHQEGSTTSCGAL